jgi:hypothetical protein
MKVLNEKRPGAVIDDLFPDGLHKGGEGMPALRLFSEYGG